MSLSMYQASVSAFVAMLKNLDAIIPRACGLGIGKLDFIGQI
jgi:hypothetical protein